MTGCSSARIERVIHAKDCTVYASDKCSSKQATSLIRVDSADGKAADNVINNNTIGLRAALRTVRAGNEIKGEETTELSRVAQRFAKISALEKYVSALARPP